MKTRLLSLVFILWLSTAKSQTGIAVPQMTAADNLVKNFLNKYAIPGATMAMAKDGKIVYMRAFGYSDINKTVVTQPYNLFRIASLSKQITSIAIMKLMQEGKLSLSAKVFGSGGILEDHPVFSTTTITDTRIYNITIQQLLEHSAGWDRGIDCNADPTLPYPYKRSGCDPIDVPLTVTMLTKTSNPVSKDAMIQYLLQKGLNFNPGTAYRYSNIGYLILGRVIEKITGKSYEEYVQQDILHPLGIFDMHCGKNLREDKLERESEYTGNGFTHYSLYNTGRLVPWEYGGFSVEAMDAHGGWIASSRDMLKLLTAVDGFATKPDMLTSATIANMVTPSANFINYAKGWNVNSNNNWWHTGALDGTTSIQVRTYHGYTWIIILNKRFNSNAFWNDLDALGWNCISQTSTWPTHDLMLSPTQNADQLSFSNATSNGVTVKWANGNGAKRILIVKENSLVNAYPLDGSNYTANATFGSGNNLGDGNFVVYNGEGNSVTVNGLTEGKTYYYRLVEFNQNSNTGNNALYLLGANPQAGVLQQAGDIYTFTGTGNWSDASNWGGNQKPPANLSSGQIIINPTYNGSCVLNVSQTISNGVKLSVAPNKKLTIAGKLERVN